jgi:hypothetical protein
MTLSVLNVPFDFRALPSPDEIIIIDFSEEDSIGGSKIDELLNLRI